MTREQILAQEIVPRPIYEAMEKATRRLFARGQTIAARRGAILVDTKYEFGDVDGRLTLIDSSHRDNPDLFDQVTGEITEEGERRLSRLKALSGTRLMRLYHVHITFNDEHMSVLCYR